MNDQETENISKIMKLLDEGVSVQHALLSVPEQFREKASEYIEMLKWIEAEGAGSPVPKSVLEKALASVVVEEKKPVARVPLSEIIPSRKKTVVLSDIPAKKPETKAIPVAVSEKKISKPIPWSMYFGKDSVFGKPVSISSWKAWMPSGAVALLLVFMFSQNAVAPIDTITPVSEDSSQNPISMAMVASEPSGEARTADFKTTPTSATETSGDPASIDDQVAILSAASDREAEAANGNDSDLADSNASYLDSANNTYDENSL